MLLTLSFAIKLSMKFAKPGINESIGYAVVYAIINAVGKAFAMLCSAIGNALTIQDAMVWYWISLPLPLTMHHWLYKML